MNDVLETVLQEWEIFPIPGVIPRSEPLKIEKLDNLPHRTLVVTGFRRVGKTYLLFQAMDELKNYNLTLPKFSVKIN